MTTAAVTGTRLRGRHSNNSSFDGQQNGCQRSVERRRHAAGGTGNKQRFSFICGQVQVLSQDRTERPAGHDDGSLSAERATGADADRRRNRLEHSNFGFDAAAPGENGLNGLGHPMTANLVRTEPRHHADDQTAGDGGAQYQPPRMVLRSRRHKLGGPTLVEDKIGHQSDQPDQAPRGGR